MKVVILLLILAFSAAFVSPADGSDSGENSCYWTRCYGPFGDHYLNHCKEGFENIKTEACAGYGMWRFKKHCCPVEE
uniref:Chitin-binding type-2 domain-containing protein n=1 Tax=Steinernema glaseri TaxID=37863 RepID=A0A1I7Y025_9BILA